MTCQHDLAERETACADGMCPICMAAQIAALKADADRSRAVLRELYGYVERGELVRDISRDNANDWSIRMAKFALTLNKASALLASEKE